MQRTIHTVSPIDSHGQNIQQNPLISKISWGKLLGTGPSKYHEDEVFLFTINRK